MTVLGALAIIDQIVPIVSLIFNYFKNKAAKAHLASTTPIAAPIGTGK